MEPGRRVESPRRNIKGSPATWMVAEPGTLGGQLSGKGTMSRPSMGRLQFKAGSKFQGRAPFCERSSSAVRSHAHKLLTVGRVPDRHRAIFPVIIEAGWAEVSLCKGGFACVLRGQCSSGRS